MAAAVVLNPTPSASMFAGGVSSVAPAATVSNSNGLPGQLHVLLVDDEKLSRVVVGNLLRKCNYKVTAIEGAREALRLLHTSAPGTFDLILSDVMMPDFNGIDLLREVRKLPFLHAVPVVMMSVNEAQQQVLECIKGGADEYLVKPVTKKEVQNIWQHVWKRTQQPRMSKGEADYEGGQAACEGAPTGDNFMGGAGGLGHHPQHSGPARNSITAATAAGAAAGGAFAGANTDVHRFQAAETAGYQNKAVGSAHINEAPVASYRPDSPSRQQAKNVVQRVLLSQWLTRPNRAVDAVRAQHEALRVFCEVLLMLQSSIMSGKHVYGRVRPCLLFLHKDVSVSFVPETLANTSYWSEEAAYCSPEETAKEALSESSDIFSLGVLFYELFLMPLLHEGTRAQHLSNLRQGVIPTELLNTRPSECAFVLSLLNPQPNSRPSLMSLIHTEQFNAVCTQLRLLHQQRQQQAAADLEVVIQFLTVVQDHKTREVHQIESNMSCLDQDIDAVSRELERRKAEQRSLKAGLLPRIPALCAPRDGTMSGADVVAAAERAEGLLHKRKRVRTTTFGGESGQNLAVTSDTECIPSGKVQRLMDAFPKLESLYFERRAAERINTQLEEGEGTSDAPDVNPTDAAKTRSSGGASTTSLSSHLSHFSKDLWTYSQHSSLQLKATLRYGDLMNASNMVCSLAFDKDEEFFASAGVSKRLKIFEYATVVDPHVSVHYPVLEITSRSKLTSVAWSSHIKSHLACSDSEGIVQLWDANNNVELMHFEEHGKRVWSVDISKVDPTRIISGSDDGTMKLWRINQEHSIATISLNSANVCSVAFSPDSEHLVACGCANYNVYLCDLRNTSVPLSVVTGHTRAVSYVKFMTGKRLVSASIDSTLKMWDMDRVASQSRGACVCTYSGHRNEKNFVGLSVTPDGYIACGSEDNAVYCYHRGMPMPIVSHEFGGNEAAVGAGGTAAATPRFVSSVCWSPKNDVLLAGNTTGAVQVLTLR